MATSSLNRLADGTIQLTLTLPWPQVQAATAAKVDAAIADTELPGFRRGKAPRDLVEPKLDKNKLLSAAIQDLLPPAYSAAIQEHSLKPILYPKLELTHGHEGHDWVFTATTCEVPIATLPDYATDIPKLEPKTKDERLKTIMDYLLKESKITLPKILIEEEANHRLAALVENITQLGMTTDSYLSTKKLTAEDLRSQLSQAAQADLALEFTLTQIQAAQKLENRTKTLDFLTALV